MGKIFETKLDAMINDVMEYQNIPGLALGVYRDNSVLYAKGFGVDSIQVKNPITNKTLFHLASVTKTFTAIAIMQLVEKGELQLDNTIVAYLPYFKMKGMGYEDITVRQVLRHGAGLPDEENYNWDKPEYDEESLERYVKGLKGLELIHSPGKKYSYSNIGYEILGDIISKVSGVSYEEYVEKNILLPLGMTDSTLLKKEAEKGTLAAPHVLDENGEVSLSSIFPYNRCHAPSSTMYSSLGDMYKYAIANINKDERILKKCSYDTMFSPQIKTGSDYEYDIFRGLSWAIGEYGGYRVISHRGQDTGFISNFILVPELSLSIIMMINLETAAMPLRAIPSLIIDMVAGREIEPLFMKNMDIEKFNGVYKNSTGDEIILNLRDNGAEMFYEGKKIRMFRDLGDVFVYLHEGSNGFSLAVMNTKEEIEGKPYIETNGNMLFQGEDKYIKADKK